MDLSVWLEEFRSLPDARRSHHARPEATGTKGASPALAPGRSAEARVRLRHLLRAGLFGVDGCIPEWCSAPKEGEGVIGPGV